MILSVYSVNVCVFISREFLYSVNVNEFILMVLFIIKNAYA